MDGKEVSKLIAPHRMELSARLPVGNKYCVLSLNVEKGGDIGELVQRCIQAENLPPYVQQPIFSCLAALLEEERRSQIKESELGMDRINTPINWGVANAHYFFFFILLKFNCTNVYFISY